MPWIYTGLISSRNKLIKNNNITPLFNEILSYIEAHSVIPNLNLTPSTKPIPTEVLKWQQKCKRLENA